VVVAVAAVPVVVNVIDWQWHSGRGTLARRCCSYSASLTRSVTTLCGPLASSLPPTLLFFR